MNVILIITINKQEKILIDNQIIQGLKFNLSHHSYEYMFYKEYNDFQESTKQ